MFSLTSRVQARRLLWRALSHLAANLARSLPTSSEYFGPPKRWYRLTRQWLEYVEPRATGASPPYLALFPAKTTRIAKAHSLDGHAERPLAARTYEAPEVFVCEIPRGRLVGQTVVTADDAILADLSQAPGASNRQHLAVFNALRLPPVEYLPGTTVSLRPFARNYFHWMFESLPGLFLLERAGIPLKEIDHFALQHCCASFQKHTLAALGVTTARILRTEDCPHLRTDRLITPSLPFNPFLPDRTQGVAGWTCDLLRSKFLDSTNANRAAAPAERLYISRGDATIRKVVNEAEVVDCLSSLGFTVVSGLSKLTVSEQASLFSAARIVVAPHGAGLANLVFSRPGTTVVEIFSPNWIHASTANLCDIMGHEYHYLVAGSARTGRDGNNAFDLLMSVDDRGPRLPMQTIRTAAADCIVVDVPSFKRGVSGVL